MKRNILKWIAYLWLTLLFCILILFLNQYFALQLDDDNGAEMILSNLLSEKFGIWDKNWYYSSELRVLNTQIIYSLLFRISKNWKFVRLAGNAIMYIIMFGALWYLCMETKIRKYFPVIASLFIIPLSFDYYLYGLHSAYLLPHITLSMLVVSMHFHFCSTENKKAKRIIFIILCLLSFAIGLAGIRHILILYFPLFLSELLFLYQRKKSLLENFTLKNPRVINAVVSFILLGIGILGFLINHLVLKNIFSFSNYYVSQYSDFCPIQSENVLNILNGWLNVWGYQTGGSIFSIKLVMNILPAVLILFIFLGGKALCISKEEKCQYEFSDNQVKLGLFFGSGFLILTVLFVFSTMFYTNRYIIPVSVFAIPVAFIYFDQLPIKVYLKKILLVLLGGLITIFALVNYGEYRKIDTSEETRKVVDILLESGYTEGYTFAFWKFGDCLTEYSNGEIEVWKRVYDLENSSFGEDNLFASRRWLETFDHNFDQPDGKCFVIFEKPEAVLNNGEILYQSDTVTVYGYESFEALRLDCSE